MGNNNKDQSATNVLASEVTDTELEAQRLAAFAKYKAEYFFDTIKETEIGGQKWRVLCQANIENTDESDFMSVINKWTHEAELIIPPIKHTTIIDDKSGSISFDSVYNIKWGTEVSKTKRSLIPKRVEKDPTLNELVVITSSNDNLYARFIPQVRALENIPFYYPKVEETIYGYQTSNHNEQTQLTILVRELWENSTTETKKHRMIWKDLIKRLYKWTATERFGYQKRAIHDVIIPYDQYTSKYQYIKSKYATKLVESWTESTDPRKFVYEDIAIASWLISLWGDDKSIRFVDLGCGNGLLVYLLRSEGYSGYGIDQSSRKIWSKFGDDVDLRAQTLSPFDFVPGDANWIIGNHADELVPWIPLIAARASHSNFVVIPCCPHDLSGKKMSFPTTAGQSKYHAYVKYISSHIEKCGYKVEKEILRIPSTKNVALVGRTLLPNANSCLDAVHAMIEQGRCEFVPRVPDSVKTQIRLERENKRYKTDKASE